METGCLNDRHLFLQDQDAGPSWGFRQEPLPGCLLSASSHGRERPLVSLSVLWGPALMASFYLYHLLTGPVSRYRVTFEVRALIWIWERGTYAVHDPTPQLNSSKQDHWVLARWSRYLGALVRYRESTGSQLSHHCHSTQPLYPCPLLVIPCES